jgi:hypothetical protein
MFTIEAYNPNTKSWEPLPVTRGSESEALTLSAIISADYMVLTRIKKL